MHGANNVGTKQKGDEMSIIAKQHLKVRRNQSRHGRGRKFETKQVAACGALCFTLLFSAAAVAGNDDWENPAPAHEMSAEELRKLNDTLAPNKGFAINYFGFDDTLLQDAGGFRSTLAEYGFGFSAMSINMFQFNTLPTPRATPRTSREGQPYPPCTPLGGVCAGGQAYVGQSLFGADSSNVQLTYDLSRWGVPDGQLQLGAGFLFSNNDAFFPNGWIMMNTLAWHQTAFDRKLDIDIGYLSASNFFMGTQLGGIFASTLGPASAISTQMGMPINAAPAAIINAHITDEFYNKIGVGRSYPVNGAQHGLTGSPIYDEFTDNPTGFNFTSGVPGNSVYVIDEFGYKNAAAPGEMFNWARVGWIHNFSKFQDLSKLTTDTNAVLNGADAFYFLYDRQLIQFDPSSPQTAYRGLYGGITVQVGQQDALNISADYEARLYAIGPFDSRPFDMISLTFQHQTFSKHLAKAINFPLNVADVESGGATYGGALANHFSNTVGLSYLAKVRPGLYGNIGLSYTDHPSITYFEGQGSSLMIQGSLVSVF